MKECGLKGNPTGRCERSVLRWFGNVERMSVDQGTKQIYEATHIERVQRAIKGPITLYPPSITVITGQLGTPHSPWPASISGKSRLLPGVLDTHATLDKRFSRSLGKTLQTLPSGPARRHSARNIPQLQMSEEDVLFVRGEDFSPDDWDDSKLVHAYDKTMKDVKKKLMQDMGIRSLEKAKAVLEGGETNGYDVDHSDEGATSRDFKNSKYRERFPKNSFNSSMPPLFNPSSGLPPFVGSLTSPSMPSFMPPVPMCLSQSVSEDSEAVSAMLMSWYMSGYHTGYYQGLKEARSNQSSGATQRSK
uniref:Survival Motor Neuron Gemin2-binding domain-containing protein n=1 Tax=Timema tahoe TaxID=61484 RepID=A0A7R9IKI2_9NEOP|nr:unnamed protein product [Timema tahoe]